MSRPPRTREVATALRGAEQEVAQAIKEQNARAASELARGHYATAEGMVQTARDLTDFRARVKALRTEWRALKGPAPGGSGSGEECTKLWEYFEPIQDCLRSLGGEAKRQELEGAIEPFLADRLKPGDQAAMSNGLPRWKVMVRRARKAMITEGLLADTPGRWRLADRGSGK